MCKVVYRNIKTRFFVDEKKFVCEYRFSEIYIYIYISSIHKRY